MATTVSGGCPLPNSSSSPQYRCSVIEHVDPRTDDLVPLDGRTLFARLDRWIIRRIHAHRYKRWRCRGYRTLPERKLYGEYGLVRLIALIPSISLPQAPL